MDKKPDKPNISNTKMSDLPGVLLYKISKYAG